MVCGSCDSLASHLGIFPALHHRHQTLLHIKTWYSLQVKTTHIDRQCNKINIILAHVEISKGALQVSGSTEGFYFLGLLVNLEDSLGYKLFECKLILNLWSQNVPQKLASGMGNTQGGTVLLTHFVTLHLCGFYGEMTEVNDIPLLFILCYLLWESEKCFCVLNHFNIHNNLPVLFPHWYLE